MGRFGRRWVKEMRAENSNVFDIWNCLGAAGLDSGSTFGVPLPPVFLDKVQLGKDLSLVKQTHPSPNVGYGAVYLDKFEGPAPNRVLRLLP
jgi:hypothetical protein